MVWWVRKGSVRELHVAKGQSLDEAITIKECEQGDFIGYATFMLDRKKRLVTAVANTPVELVGLSKSLFLQLVCSNPELEVKLRAHAQEIIAETESFIATRLREGKLGYLLKFDKLRQDPLTLCAFQPSSM